MLTESVRKQSNFEKHFQINNRFVELFVSLYFKSIEEIQ